MVKAIMIRLEIHTIIGEKNVHFMDSPDQDIVVRFYQGQTGSYP